MTSVPNIKEEQIRPKHLFDRFLELTTRDAIELSKSGRFENVDCVACGARGKDLFEKHSFRYQECPECLTIFASPRPTRGALSDFYEKSESAKYWDRLL